MKFDKELILKQTNKQTKQKGKEMHKKTDLTEKSKFENLPDGEYPAVLESAKVDLQNKYGPRVNLTFKLPNNRKSWIDIRENAKGTLNGAWFTCKKLGFATEMNEDLGEEFTTEDFLNAAGKYVDSVVGHYFTLELKTLDTKNGKKQYGSVIGNATASEFDQFNTKSAIQKSNVPALDGEEELPF